MKSTLTFGPELTFLFHFFILQVVNCLYEDQVNKFDWRQQYIGKVKFSHIDPAIAGIHKFAVVTEENTLACLSTRTGSVIWRQIMEKDRSGEINALSEDGDLITVGGNGQFIRSWDPNTGVLLWETSFPTSPNKDAIQYFEVNHASKEVVQVQMFPKQHARVSIYSYTRGSLKTSEIIKSPWFTENTHCKFISSNYFVCVERNNIHLLSIKDGAAFISVNAKSLGLDVSDKNNMKVVSMPYQSATENTVFALQSENEAVLLEIVPPGIKFIKTLPSVKALTSTIIDYKLAIFSLSHTVALDGNSTYQISGMDAETQEELSFTLGAFTISENRGNLEKFYVLPYVKKDHGVSYKMLLLFEDHSILLIHHQGRMIWSREEALSGIISTELLDLPLSETDANIEQEFSHTDASLISLLLTRLKSQVYFLQTFLLKVLIGFKGEIDMGRDNKGLTRDTFGLHKIIVVITKSGKSFGIDNLSGLIIWSHFEKNFAPFIVQEKLQIPLFVQRTTAHFPYPPVCTAIGRDNSSNKGKVYSFDPITGTTIESKVMPYEVLQVMPSSTLNNHLRGILLLDAKLKVHVYPESHDIYKNEKSHFFFTGDSKSGTLIGYFLQRDLGNTLKAVEAWKINLPQPIIKIATKKPQEQVHSQGRVMGDRSVLYKYINPNLAAVFTEGNDVIQKTFCNIYLVDTITGLIVYSASHKRCKMPLHVVHSENCLVYSFYNEKSRRFEISSIELYEGMYQSNTTAFSSFTPPPLPLVEHQTFIFPSAIEAMADTVTERGMTSKHILIALPSGGILELPKNFLDPRRPIHPLPEHREEGLIPYIPELPIMSDGIINYNQSVARVKGIVTAPSALESTCLVFVHGLDLFYTRVTPSKTFDILKDDFDHYLISVVLLGLLILSYTTKRLAARKTLRAAWK